MIIKIPAFSCKPSFIWHSLRFSFDFAPSAVLTEMWNVPLHTMDSIFVILAFRCELWSSFKSIKDYQASIVQRTLTKPQVNGDIC